MKITVKDPETGENLEMDASPAQINTQDGWSVILPNGQSVFITLYNGRWEGRNNKVLSKEFVNAIGKAINPSSVGDSSAIDPEPVQEEPQRTITEEDVDELMRKIDENEYKKKFL